MTRGDSVSHSDRGEEAPEKPSPRRRVSGETGANPPLPPPPTTLLSHPSQPRPDPECSRHRLRTRTFHSLTTILLLITVSELGLSPVREKETGTHPPVCQFRLFFFQSLQKLFLSSKRGRGSHVTKNQRNLYAKSKKGTSFVIISLECYLLLNGL